MAKYGYGFIPKGFTDGRVYLVRCFKCGRENYLPNVANGTCPHCGYDCNKDEDMKQRIRDNDGDLRIEVDSGKDV